MNEVLSQDEIDQLLSAISTGEVDADEMKSTTEQKKIKIYDFKRPDKFSKDQIRTISMIHETFARLTTTSLSAQLRAIVHVHVVSVDQLTYEEFIRSIPNPTTLAVVDMEPLKGSAVLEIDPSITFAIIEKLFGGRAEGSQKISRELTDIEQAVIEGVIVRILGNLRESWTNVIDLRPRLGRIDVNPQFAQIVPPTDMVVLVTLETKVGEVEGMTNFCIPYITIEPVINKLSGQYWYSSVRKGTTTENLALIKDKLNTVKLEMAVEIGNIDVKVKDVVSLKIGDCIKLSNVKISDNFRVKIGGLTKFECRPGKVGTKMAFQIVKKVDDIYASITDLEEGGGSIMSDGALSQDEIDALLQGTDDSLFDFGGEAMEEVSSGSLSNQETNALLTLITETSSNVGDALGAMIEKKIIIRNPKIEVVSGKVLSNQLPGEIVEVKMDIQEGVPGEHIYYLTTDNAKVVSGLMMGQNGNDLTDAALSAVSEALNVISGNMSNKLGTKIGKSLKPEPPVVAVKPNSNLSVSQNSEYLKIQYEFQIEGDNQYPFYEIYGLNIAKEIVSIISPATNQSTNNKQVNNQNSMGGMNPQMMGMNPQMMGMNPQMMGMNPQMMGMNPQMMGMNPQMMYGQVPVKGVQFPDLNNLTKDGQESNIQLLMDVNMELTVELGRTRKTIKEILGMGEGTVIELDKLAGEPVDVLVNGQLIAKGEVVVIDENFGVRVTEIINPMDRLKDFT